jgi:CHASE2 domain-containing sensor protein
MAPQHPHRAGGVVAIGGASLSTPDLAALPRALFQPVWARLIDGLLEARARRIAFDVVFAYAGGPISNLPDYDRSLIDSLDRARDRIVLGRFPSVPPAPPFQRAAGGDASEFSSFSLNQMEGCEAPRHCSASLMAVSHWDSPPWGPD